MRAARSLWIAIALCAMAVTASAQDDPARHDDPAEHGHQDDPPEHQHQDDRAEHQHHEAAASSTWTWATDANVFAGYNYQERHFADVSAWESQNWLMGSGSRPIRSGRLTVASMISLEPFTLNAHG